MKTLPGSRHEFLTVDSLNRKSQDPTALAAPSRPYRIDLARWKICNETCVRQSTWIDSPTPFSKLPFPDS